MTDQYWIVANKRLHFTPASPKTSNTNITRNHLCCTITCWTTSFFLVIFVVFCMSTDTSYNHVACMPKWLRRSPFAIGKFPFYWISGSCQAELGLHTIFVIYGIFRDWFFAKHMNSYAAVHCGGANSIEMLDASWNRWWWQKLARKQIEWNQQ